MKVLKDSIWCLAAEGRLTLQVPQFSVGPDETEEIPDGWICEAKKEDGPPVHGKQRGFWFLTRAGYDANREIILEKFSSTPDAIRGYSRKGYSGLGGKPYLHLIDQFCEPSTYPNQDGVFYPKPDPANLRGLFEAWVEVTLNRRDAATKKVAP